MNYLLDTCTLSELTRAKPDPSVSAWVFAQQESQLFLSVLTIGELRKGIDRLASGRKRLCLLSWLESALKVRFAGRLLPVDAEVAERWGILAAVAMHKGRTLPVLDGFIAATALVHGMTVVTRNVADMDASGALLLNPWE